MGRRVEVGERRRAAAGRPAGQQVLLGGFEVTGPQLGGAEVAARDDRHDLRLGHAARGQRRRARPARSVRRRAPSRSPGRRAKAAADQVEQHAGAVAARRQSRGREPGGTEQLADLGARSLRAGRRPELSASSGVPRAPGAGPGEHPFELPGRAAQASVTTWLPTRSAASGQSPPRDRRAHGVERHARLRNHSAARRCRSRRSRRGRAGPGRCRGSAGATGTSGRDGPGPGRTGATPRGRRAPRRRRGAPVSASARSAQTRSTTLIVSRNAISSGAGRPSTSLEQVAGDAVVVAGERGDRRRRGRPRPRGPGRPGGVRRPSPRCAPPSARAEPRSRSTSSCANRAAASSARNARSAARTSASSPARRSRGSGHGGSRRVVDQQRQRRQGPLDEAQQARVHLRRR